MIEQCLGSLEKCGPVYRRLSMEISGLAWCESSSKGEYEQGGEVVSPPHHPVLSQVGLGLQEAD